MNKTNKDKEKKQDKGCKTCELAKLHGGICYTHDLKNTSFRVSKLLEKEDVWYSATNP